MPVRRAARSSVTSRVVAVTSLVAASLPGCGKGSAGGPEPAPSASATPGGLAPELAARVLAHVGPRTITLGDYAAVLDRMDRFERLRYQTADRRKQLLDEMIDVELLAREAERRGLSKKPETEELVRVVLRDELLRDLRSKQPRPEDIPAGEVRAYYDAHRADFREPERRRIGHIVVAARSLAEKVLKEAEAATPAGWGELAKKYSLEKKDDDPPELAGDLGLVTPPSAGPSDNAKVPEAVRAAAFEIEKPGTILGHVVEADGKFHVVRLTSRNDPRDRSLEEADRTIRVRLVQDQLRKAEAAYEKELREKYPVKIDDAALAKVPLPEPGKKP